MPHIQLPEGLPGILGPMAFRPETAKPLNELAETLLRGPNTLSPGERELIATFASAQNDCFFCQTIHGAVAAHHLGSTGICELHRRSFCRTEREVRFVSRLIYPRRVPRTGHQDCR